MRQRLYYYLSFCLLLMACENRKQPAKVDVETFFKDPEQAEYRISPNGKLLSFLKPSKGKMNVFVRSVDDDVLTQVTALTDKSVRNCYWVGEDKLLYILENDSSYQRPAFLIDVDGGHIIPVQDSSASRIEIIDLLTDHKTDILIALNERNQSFLDVYRLNVYTGKRTLEVENPGSIILWISDGDGNINLAVGSDGVNETLFHRENSQQRFSPIITNNFKNTFKPVGFTPDKEYIIALSNLNRDKLALVKFDYRTKKEVGVIYENPNVDIGEISRSVKGNKLTYLTYETDKANLYFLDSYYKQVYKEIGAELPNQEIKIVDTDVKEKNFVIQTYTDKSPGSYYLYNSQSKKLIKLADVNSEIDPENMCVMKSVSYQTRDGVMIHGYLTLPIGAKDNNLPCIVMPHRGPSIRNSWGYSPEVQYLANLGYAVFQVNYRGSTGYGKAFKKAGFKEWGGKIQNDIFDGVQWLIKQGTINPEQIGVFGYGFGGYSALNQAIAHPDLYRCAASYSGYINLFTYLKGVPAFYKPYEKMIHEIVGNPKTDITYLKNSSPVFQINKMKTPLLIAQGGKNSKVNVNETNQFVKELRKNKVPVVYILNENEMQLFKETSHKLTFYKQLGDFLDTHIKN